jgi:hypothetical protein
VLERFKVLLVGVAAPRQEQQPAARILTAFRPVDPADRVAVGRQPAAFAGVGGNGAAVETRDLRRIPLANSSLLPVVTF